MMKIFSFTVLVLALLTTTFLDLFLCAAAATSNTTVLDVDGHKLQTKTNYYILPVIRGRGGGLALAPRNKSSCPFYVAQESLEVSKGLPVKFYPAKTKYRSVKLSADMNFVFSAATICVQSTGWKLGNVDEVTGRRYVKSGGAIGNPGLNTVSSWFKIDKYRKDEYKLQHCPHVCSFCKVVCGDVGVFVENGIRWLGLSDVPFPVMFQKA